MNLSLILLQSGECLIAMCEELEYEPRVHMVKPHLVSGKTKVTLTPWPNFTNDEHVLLCSTDLLTMVDPTEDLADKYLKKVGVSREELDSPRDDRVLLNEGESVPDGEDYEPRYVEDDLY